MGEEGRLSALHPTLLLYPSLELALYWSLKYYGLKSVWDAWI